jgi:hypothetical protein
MFAGSLGLCVGAWRFRSGIDRSLLQASVMTNFRSLLIDARQFVGKSRCSVGHSVSEVLDRAKPGDRHCLYCEQQAALHERLVQAIADLTHEPGAPTRSSCEVPGCDGLAMVCLKHVAEPGADPRDAIVANLRDALAAAGAEKYDECAWEAFCRVFDRSALDRAEPSPRCCCGEQEWAPWYVEILDSRNVLHYADRPCHHK